MVPANAAPSTALTAKLYKLDLQTHCVTFTAYAHMQKGYSQVFALVMHQRTLVRAI